MKRLVILAIAALAILGMQFLSNCASPLESTTEPDPFPPRPPDTIYDTTTFVVDHWDTLFDTTYMGDTVEYWDTVTIFDTSFFTDTLLDTTLVTDTVPVFDTTYITDTVPEYDTTYITDTVPEYDTTYITDTVPEYDTTYITDTVPEYDTTYITDTVPEYDTTYITDTVPEYDTTYITDTIEVTDTIYVDTICPILMCTELNSGNMSVVWMLHNTEGNYRLRFTSEYVWWDPTKPLIIDIDGTEYVWEPMTVPELIIDRWLDDDAVITVWKTPEKDAMIHPIDICVSVTPELIE